MTSLTLYQDRTVTPSVWQMIESMAPVIYKSRMFMKTATSTEAAQAIMLKSRELGFPFTAGFEFIQMIDGKLELSPRGALALLHNSPEIAEVQITRLGDERANFVGYECRIVRTNGFEHTSRFTLADAQKAKLVKPDGNWEKYPENMCQWRAIGFCADVAAPDVLAGMTGLLKMPEGKTITEEGDVVVDAVVTEQPAPAAKAISLTELVDRFGAEAIMAANGGAIPGTSDEVALVASKLIA